MSKYFDDLPVLGTQDLIVNNNNIDCAQYLKHRQECNNILHCTRPLSHHLNKLNSTSVSYILPSGILWRRIDN